MSGQRASISRWSGENPKALGTQHNGKNLRVEQTQRMGGNLMAVRTKQIGVNPEIEVAYSHMLPSKGVNTSVGSTHINQDERSSSGNVFQRLGCGADLRDMLNKGRDQEQSQQPTARNGPVEAPGVQRGILVEDLRYAIAAMKENGMEFIAATTGSPFTQEVRKARLPKGFKRLTTKAQDRKSDPQKHLTTSMTSWNYAWSQNWQNADYSLSL